MKRTKNPLFLFLWSLFPAILFSFSGCKKDLLAPQSAEQVTVPAIGDLNRVLFVNDNLGYIVGGDKYSTSDILTTTDGGATWSLYHLATGDSKAVYGLAIDGERVYGAGYDGKIYFKENQQSDWQRVQTSAWEWFQQIVFPQPDKGFIITGDGYRAGRIYRTDHTAALTLVDSFEYELADICFADAQTGYTCGYGAVLKTEDGGTTWHLQDVKGDFFRSISCVGPDLAWIVGYNGSIIHTTDGGRQWTRQRDGNNPLLKRYRLRGVVFKDGYTGYAVGDGGLMIKTTDAGAHWSEFEKFTDKDLRGIALKPDGSVWVVGLNGTVFHIRD